MATQDQQLRARTAELERELAEKNAELHQKNRDLQIEASLERIRAVTLTMKQPDDVLSICKIMFSELQSLGFGNLRNAIINFWDDASASLVDYDYSDYAGGHIARLAYSSHPAFEKFQQRIRSATDAFAELIISESELDSWKKRRRSDGEYEDPRLEGISALYYYFYSTGVGAIGISTFSSLSEEKLKTLKRFRNVFDFAYRRYMDVALAEAQAREAKIEASLERVRSKAMAMQKSEDLATAVATVFEELDKLNLGMLRCGIGILNKEKMKVDVWTTTVSDHGKTVQVSGDESMDIHPLLRGAYDAWIRQEDFSYVLKGEDLVEYYRALTKTNFRLPDSQLIVSEKEGLQQYYFNAIFQAGGLFAFRETEFSGEAKTVMKRFAGVFSLTYKRFLDLQKAEAQTRESQIQLALERVRARTMAMQKSDELSETSFVLFQQLKELGEVALQISIGIYNEEERVMELYATFQGNQWNESGRVEFDKHEVHRKIFAAWKDQKKSLVLDLSGEELRDYNKFKIETGKGQYKSENELPKDRWVMHAAFFSKGVLFFSAHEPHPSETVQLLERFAGVFDLTYTRFLDLKQAEAQAREAQIEAALERVRGKAMAMHNSNDLSATANRVFIELRKLGIHPIRTGVTLLAKNSKEGVFYAGTSSEESEDLAVIGSIDMTAHPCLQMQYESWLKKENYFPELNEEEQESYYKALFAQPSVPVKSEELRRGRYGYYFPFDAGLFYAWTESPYSENEINILNRFKAITDLTFRRYLDLQKAEAQAREAQIEAGLERVRSRTLAMHSSDELAETAAVLFKQLINLGIEPNRLYIGIMKDETGNAEFWITDEDGIKVSSKFDANLNDNQSFQKMLKGWREQGKSITIDMQGDELKEYLNHLNQLNVPFKIGLSQKRRVQNISYFSQGFIGIASPDSQPQETTQLLERFASVFNLTYTRFNDLKLAEAHAISAQIEEQKLREEKKRADALLLNILPEEIANELKEFGKSYARKHDEVTILFADIKGFSTIAENLSAEELVNQLDECFRAFDHIVEKNGMEKIKTVGDAYVCACGLPKPVPDNAVKAVKAALDMMNFIKGFAITKTIQDLPAFEFRIGIHTGPVITGVVGLKKFTYDIWGDAVNMAARMEQHGEAGKINISGNTYQLIKNKFTCTYRGKIKAKNKGEVDMYFVEHIM